MEIELLKREPDGALTEVQVKTFRLLLELAEAGKPCSIKEIVQRSNLSSPLAFWSRLRRLEAKGLIRTANPSAAQMPASTLIRSKA